MKKACLVGINYVDTPNELRGCINDVHSMHGLLLNELSFDEARLIVEKEATTQGILNGMKWLVAGAVPGDVLFFHYSGHGSQIRSTIEPDGLDEIICPIDLNWRDKVIRDDDMKAIFGSVPNGVNLTVVLDCCHSGTALDQEDTMVSARVFVDQASAKKADNSGRFMPMPEQVQADIDQNQLEVRAFKTSRDINRSALLIAGCKSDQTSADAFIEGTFQGAATYALRSALADGHVTYRDIVDDMTEFMVSNGYDQRPQLDGHPSLYDQAFAEPWGTIDGTVEATPSPGIWVEPIVEEVTEEVAAQQAGKSGKLLAVAALLVAFLVYVVIA